MSGNVRRSMRIAAQGIDLCHFLGGRDTGDLATQTLGGRSRPARLGNLGPHGRDREASAAFVSTSAEVSPGEMTSATKYGAPSQHRSGRPAVSTRWATRTLHREREPGSCATSQARQALREAGLSAVGSARGRAMPCSNPTERLAGPRGQRGPTSMRGRDPRRILEASVTRTGSCRRPGPRGTDRRRRSQGTAAAVAPELRRK